MLPPEIETRPLTANDVDAMLEIVRAGLASFAEFAPAGWPVPAGPANRERTLESLATPDSWALLALIEGEPAGHVIFTHARERPGGPDDHGARRPRIPGTAHVGQLFVAPQWWGSGVAGVLHEAAAAEMSGRGYRHARLYTPSLHARARRFYERRGWDVVAEHWSPEMGLDLAEYRLDLA